MNKVIMTILLLLFCQSTEAADIRVCLGFTRSITIAGRIIEGDFEKFKELLYNENRYGNVIDQVRIATYGGDVLEAIKIGDLIRQFAIPTTAPLDGDCSYISYFFDAYTKDGIKKIIYDNKKKVDRIIINNTEEKTEYYKHVIKYNCACDSAGFLIWAAGSRRDGNIVGLHRPYIEKSYFKKFSMKDASKVYKEIKILVTEYLQDMGISNYLIKKMYKYSSNNRYYLNPEEILDIQYAPWFEEWLLASCGSHLTKKEAIELRRLENKYIQHKNLSNYEDQRMHKLSSRESNFHTFTLNKIEEVQKKLQKELWGNEPINIGALDPPPKSHDPDLELPPFEPGVDPWTLN